MNSVPPLWSYVSQADFNAPAPPAAEVAKGGVRALWNRLRNVLHPSPDRPRELFFDRVPAAVVREAASPKLHWGQALETFAAEFDAWSADDHPDGRHRVLIGPPGCDVAAVLQSFAQSRELPLLEPLSVEALLGESDAADWPCFESANAPGVVVIPKLTGFYLRHANGLTMVRRLLQQISTSPHRVLVGCDSWAWSFLRRAVGIEQILTTPITFAPFDGSRLDAWFRADPGVSRYEFRRQGADKTLFPPHPPLDPQAESSAVPPASATLHSLAAYSRGNPAVAAALWREGLRTGDPDDEPTATADHAAKLWLLPPAQIIPGIPDQLDRIHRFILHSVLLHGGVTRATLQRILPFEATEILRRVRALCHWELLEESSSKLQVRLTAYPAVRQDLMDEGFLTDDF